MSMRTGIRATAALAAIAMLVVAALVPDSASVLLTLAPAVALFALLLSGHYVGEDRIARLARAWRARRVRPARSLRVAPVRPRGRVPRGGRLIAAALAVRPPPAALPVR
ncbi:hypothetical protein [Patulibacter defluvii]|uniref:hypothetical protein n=1 Tax=Patulibacter defluvii TaxID=3095358 RepID=UPI002A75630E|nr:hypothetical protein [Patulibacter sp. DM4]